MPTRTSLKIAVLGVSLTACSDAGVTKFNTDPTAEISSHADGDTVREGYAETLRGTVGDANHAIDELTVSWLVDGVDVCPDSAPDGEGLVTCDHTFAATGGEVLLEVRDPEGGSGSAEVTVDVQPTDAPEAEITAPTQDGVYYSDQLTTLEGTVSDEEDEVSALTVVWESSVDGALTGGFNEPDSEGGLLGAVTLSEGEHFLTLTVTDSTGKEGRDSTTIQVGPPNSSPTCEITSPADGDAGPEGEEVRFEALVSDVDVPASLLTVAWSSDVDGPLRESTPDTDGTTGFASGALTVATHRITLTVTDEVGGECVDSVYYTVGTPPTLTVTSPTTGEVVNEDASVAFAATVSDNEDLPTDIALFWSSDVDGEFSTQGADSTGAVSFSWSDLSPGDHVLTVRATDTDGLYAQTTLDLTVNQVPTAPTVTLSPDPAYTANTLTASATGSTDPDGSGTVTYSYAWYVDGVASSVSTTATFPSADTQKDSTYRVVVTPTDGTGDGSTGEAEVTVDNTAPVLTGPSLSASSVQVGDVLTCTASATDADAVDTPTVSYAWSDGSTGSTYTVSSADNPGDTITCTATADDGDGGTDTGTATATVDNTAPVMGTVTVSPSSGQVGDTLTCSASATDADGGTPTITYAWSGGSTGSTYTITSSDNPGDTLTCTATADDGDGGTDTGTATATVDNTEPVMGLVFVSPSSGQVGDTITCSASATDADGGTPTITYAWSGGSTGSTYTIAASDNPGDTLTCTATADDGDGGTDTGTATATVDNTAPVMGTVTVSPSTGQVGDVLTCSASATDADGGTPTITYAWSDGSTGSTYTVSSADNPGDTLTCTATADDGDGGTDTGTASATVDNTAPVMGTVTVSPSSGQVGDVLTCSASATDVDGGTPTITYAWSGGSTGSTYTITSSDNPGDTLTCTATADDGDGGTDSGTATATVDNTEPVMGLVFVSPSSGQVGDTITCSASATDADGGTPTITYAWSGGSTGSTYTIAASDNPGDTLTCTATADDGDGGTDTGTATATVDNTAPVMGTVTVSPSTAQVGDVLTCVASATDADGGTPTITYAWSDGSTGSTYTVSSADNPGDTITCTATADDGDGGTDSGTATATVDNTAPVMGTVTVSPSSGQVGDTLTCSASATDADGGTPTITYAWSGGSTGSTYTITSSDNPGDTLTCTATADDGDGGTDTGSASATVDNTEPVMGLVFVSPSSGQVGDTLTCSASATDADGGTPTITYAWSGGSTGSTYTIAASDNPGDTITCTATADDGDGGTDSGTATATVDNTAPVMGMVTVSPSSAQVGDTLTCSASATDADGGTPTITYAWSGGSTGSTYTITSSDNPGDTLTCTATADDGDGGTDTGTATATVDNTAPVMGTVTISPSLANNDDTLTCSASATDADGGTPTITYAWSGSSAGSLGTGSSIDLSTTAVASAETVTCTATADDGDGGTDTGTATLTTANRNPTVSVTLSPSSGATRTDTLTCTATASDDDGDSTTTTFSWTVDGASVSASSSSSLTSTLAGAFVAGTVVACTGTTIDGKGGTDDDTASTTISNTAPTVSTPSLAPSTVYTNDTLTANVTTSDAEGDTLTVTYDWYVDGSSVQDGADNTLSGVTLFDKDQDVFVIVTADDGTDTTTATSATVTVSNTPPTAPVVTIDPSDPVSGADLYCEVTTASTDADGDAVTYSMAWMVDGAAYSGALTTTWTDDTADGGDTVVDEVWECIVTPNDGDDDGSTASDSVTITQSCNDGSVALSASGVDFVEICSGSFDMGCTAGQSSCWSNESPVMPVTLTRNYYLSQTEVTQGQYQALMGTNPSTYSTCGTDCPVETATWNMAMALANNMSAAEGLNECYDCSSSGSSLTCNLAMNVYACDGYRLPTEAEWEGAARCGEDLLYAGSNTVRDVGWYHANSGSSPQSVATLAPNACGLYDMSGNVFEFTQDWHSGTYYSSSGMTDPTGAAPGTHRSGRGGSWRVAASELRVAYRSNCPSNCDTIRDDYGIRLARTVDGDYDGDGYLLSEDCDDTDASIHPFAGDTYGDGIDSDCDGLDCEADSDGSTYFAVCHDASLNWSDAEGQCTGAGYQYGAILNSTENAFVQSLMVASGNNVSWLGLRTDESQWRNGEAISYTNWAPGEPSGDGSCVWIEGGTGYNWNDHSCSAANPALALGFVCEAR